MDLIRFMFRTAPSAFVLSAVFSAVAGLATTALLVEINYTLNHAYSIQKSALAFCILMLLALSFRSLAGLQLASLGQSSLFHLRRDLTRRIMATSFRTLETVGPSRILAVLTDDVLAITNFVANGPVLITNIAILCACLGYLAFLSWQMLAVVLGFIIAGLVSYEFLLNRANRHIVLARDRGTTLLHHFRSLISGGKELKLHRRRRELFLTSCVEETAQQYRRHMLDGLKVYTGAVAWGELLMFMTIGAVLFISLTTHLASGTKPFAFVLILLYLVGPLESVINLAPQGNRATVALENVNKLGLSLTADVDQVSQHDSPAVAEEIRLHEVAFRYASEDGSEFFSVGPLTLTLPPGRIVFIVGGNGSGKSTFAKILTGLYPPSSGTISVGDRIVQDSDRDDYRQRFARPSSPISISSRLCWESRTRTWTVRRPNCWNDSSFRHKVSVTGGAFSTLDLSTGQRKRLALLTAYLEDRPFYLFDEWAADQDPTFKHIFYFNILLDLRSRGKTVFVITHDDRYFHVADRIIKLDFGNVVSDETQDPALLSGERLPT